MTDAPKTITAWVNADGSTQFAGDKLFPKGVEVEYVREDLTRRLQDALGELVTCVEDGCYCSEMRMAAAVDDANAALSDFNKAKEVAQ